MASHNPILNVYIVSLNPIEDSHTTFRDFIKAKYFEPNSTKSDKVIFQKYAEEFIKNLGEDEYKKDKKDQKVVGVSKIEGGGKNKSINILSNKNIIEGVIEGGKYGLSRDMANINNKEKRGKIDIDQAILDKFYFLLYTPLNNKFGIFMIQSYTEETIQMPFKRIVENFFSVKEYFYKLVIEPYVPQKFIDKYINESKVRLFKFSNKPRVSNTYGQKIVIDGMLFEAKIELKPLEEIKPKPKTISKILDLMKEIKFGDKKLSAYEPSVFLKNNDGKKANFDIEKELSSIKPTIYLENEGVNIDGNSGSPNFLVLKNYCLNLLEGVYSEFMKNIDKN